MRALHTPVASSTASPASAFATGMAHRFIRPLRDSSYDRARLRIARYALAPGKLSREQIWTGRGPGTVSLTARGALTDGRYRFQSAERVSMPSAVGESRHFVALDSLAEGDRRWRTEVDQALGGIAPLALSRATTALLESAERSETEMRADYRRHANRVTTALGRYATMQNIQTARRADGSTLVELTIVLDPAALDSSYAAFSRYLRKYVSPARFHFELRDPIADASVEAATATANDRWLTLDGARDTVRLRFRSHNGQLQPLEGPSRARPDTLTLHAEAYAKFGLFTVGMREVRGQFVFLSSPREVGWDMRFAEAPRWKLPPLAGRLVRGSLSRPFEGEGIHLRLSVRQLGNGQTVLHRASEMEVRESRIMRWLGNLGFTAMSDFAGVVEQQEARFLAEALRGFREDLEALPPKAEAH
jgi:hypothetical protein